MLGLKRELLDSMYGQISVPETLSACMQQHGLYHTAHFVLRLSPENHRLLESGASKEPGKVTWDEAQAYSTYIHETVHWWQHIGSTSGLMLSMCYPSQAHVNVGRLRELAGSGVVGKSIKSWAKAQLMAGVDESNSLVASANSVVNNVTDLEYFRIVVLDPELIMRSPKDNYFESVGHSFKIAYSACLNVIETTLGGHVSWLPKYHKWGSEIDQLVAKKIGHYHYGSTIVLPPVSGLSLLEGQARFIQLQFLEFAGSKFGKSAGLVDFARRGYMDGVYGEAFKYFISNTDSEFPISTDDPIVGLFLLVCDLALNPGEGFPFDIGDFENFPLNVSPAIRFSKLCRAVRLVCPELKVYLVDYSREEYIYASEILSEACGYYSPIAMLEEIISWGESDVNVVKLLGENKEFRFSDENMPVRLIFSQFLMFSRDKYEAPEFFCWSGRFRHTQADARYNELWLRNLSWFTDKENDNGIFPRMIPGKKLENILGTLNSFYGNSMNYDLTRQWTLCDGAFEYDFSWLTEQYSYDEVREKARWLFEGLYGVSVDEIEGVKY